LDPSNEFTFQLLTGLLDEVTGGKQGAGLFPENLIHLGGDEVNTHCWSDTSRIADWMRSKGYSADQAYMYQ